jgi:hypothetical protein
MDERVRAVGARIRATRRRAGFDSAVRVSYVEPRSLSTKGPADVE